MDREKLGNMVRELIVGVLIAWALMFGLFMLYGVFILIWEGAGLMWAFVYLVGAVIGGGLGVKHFA